MTTPTFRKYLSGVIWGLSPGTRLPNLKFVPSAVLELLAFNAQKFIMGSRDLDHAHFSEIFVRGHVGTIPENTRAKFEVRTFSRFGTDRQTGTGLSETTAWLYGYCRTLDTGDRRPFSTDYIFCPMLLCSALDRQLDIIIIS